VGSVAATLANHPARLSGPLRRIAWLFARFEGGARTLDHVLALRSAPPIAVRPGDRIEALLAGFASGAFADGSDDLAGWRLRLESALSELELAPIRWGEPVLEHLTWGWSEISVALGDAEDAGELAPEVDAMVSEERGVALAWREVLA